MSTPPATRPYPPAEPTVLSLDDAGEILTLQRAAYVTEAAAHNDFTLPPLTQTSDELRSELRSPMVTALGIRESGRLVAAVRLRRDGDVLELGRLTVAPDRQGTGLGTTLLRAAEDLDDQIREIRLFTGEHSRDNLRLYARLGYSETERTPAGGYRLVHLRKALIPDRES